MSIIEIEYFKLARAVTAAVEMNAFDHMTPEQRELVNEGRAEGFELLLKAGLELGKNAGLYHEVFGRNIGPQWGKKEFKLFVKVDERLKHAIPADIYDQCEWWRQANTALLGNSNGITTATASRTAAISPPTVLTRPGARHWIR